MKAKIELISALKRIQGTSLAIDIIFHFFFLSDCTNFCLFSLIVIQKTEIVGLMVSLSEFCIFILLSFNRLLLVVMVFGLQLQSGWDLLNLSMQGIVHSVD